MMFLVIVAGGREQLVEAVNEKTPKESGYKITVLNNLSKFLLSWDGYLCAFEKTSNVHQIFYLFIIDPTGVYKQDIRLTPRPADVVSCNS